MKWRGSLNPKPATWASKKMVPAEHRIFARRIEFLFALAWVVVRADSGILTTEGWVPVFTIWDTDGGHIGYAQPNQPTGAQPCEP